MNTAINFKNDLSRKLFNSLMREKINFKFIDSNDKVLDDEMIIWAGKKNGLKIVLCDSFMYTRDFVKVVKSITTPEKTIEKVLYEGNSIKSVILTVKRTLDAFNKRKEFYFKNKTEKKS